MDSITYMNGHMIIPTSELIPGRFIVYESKRVVNPAVPPEEWELIRIPCIIKKVRESRTKSNLKSDGLVIYDGTLTLTVTNLKDGKTLVFSIVERMPSRFLLPTIEENRMAIPYIA